MKKKETVTFNFSGSATIETKSGFPKEVKNIMKKMIDMGFQDVKVRKGE